MNIVFDQIATRIIKEQEFIIGPLAWIEARKVPGLVVLDQKSGEVHFDNGDPKDILNKLVAQYEKIFGRASREVCREAAASLLADLSKQDIPENLQ